MIEFYVILAVIAAAIVAFASRPHTKGPVEEYLLAGEMADSEEGAEPSIEIRCYEDGNVTLTRLGLDCIADDGAVSLAIKVSGTDVTIEERLTPGRGEPIGITEARFRINFMRPNRYHVMYNSGKTGLFAAFPLHVTPGMRVIKILSR